MHNESGWKRGTGSAKMVIKFAGRNVLVLTEVIGAVKTSSRRECGSVAVVWSSGTRHALSSGWS